MSRPRPASFPTRSAFAGASARAGAAILLLAGLAGCVRQPDFTLEQPFARGGQQKLQLISRQKAFAVVDGRQTYFVSFPLPGSESGPRAFVVYFTAPDVVTDHRVNPDDLTGARGFLIQEIGQLAGRTDWARGALRIRNVFLAPQRRKVTFDVACEDGSVLRGATTFENMPVDVRAFEREFPGDVALLLAPLAPPAEPAAESGDEAAAPPETPEKPAGTRSRPSP